MSDAILNIPKEASKNIRQFYDKYAGMLLGFIQGIVPDAKKSEEHLIKIITSFVLETKLNADSNISTWIHLRRHAQQILAQQNFSERPASIVNLDQNSLSEDVNNILTAPEKMIFQAVYYQGRSITCIAESLGEKENSVRIQLKSAMDKMRRLRGN
jgi:DNA-directed RNA polymerase specialized sigma subunit